jgi:hypothetical protein
MQYYELVISCVTCGAQHSISNLAEMPNLNDAEVLATAKHSPNCAVPRSGTATVQETPREDEPNTVLYEIREAH